MDPVQQRVEDARRVLYDLDPADGSILSKTKPLPHLLTRRPMRRPPRLPTRERLLINHKHEVRS